MSPGWGWYRGWGPYPGRGPFSYLPPWQRPGWIYGPGWCWWYYARYGSLPTFPLPTAQVPTVQQEYLEAYRQWLEDARRNLEREIQELDKRI
ncbi:MAG: hypothetical protein ACPLRJ_05980, partial [Infirmifilum uzonense]